MKKQRRNVTLIEMMIVMFLIALITGVVAYNYRGSLDEGKVFKTKAGKERIETILNLAVAEGKLDMDRVASEWQEIIDRSPLVQNKDALKRDGWGALYEVYEQDGRIVVISKNLEAYENRSGNK